MPGGPECCLIDSGIRCPQPAGKGRCNAKMLKMIKQRRHKLTVQPDARHNFICDIHKSQIQSLRSRQTRKANSQGESTDDQKDIIKIDFNAMENHTLKRIKHRHRLHTNRPGYKKHHLVELVEKGFKKINVPEEEVISNFISSVNKKKNTGDTIRCYCHVDDRDTCEAVRGKEG